MNKSKKKLSKSSKLKPLTDPLIQPDRLAFNHSHTELTRTLDMMVLLGSKDIRNIKELCRTW